MGDVAGGGSALARELDAPNPPPSVPWKRLDEDAQQLPHFSSYDTSHAPADTSHAPAAVGDVAGGGSALAREHDAPNPPPSVPWARLDADAACSAQQPQQSQRSFSSYDPSHAPPAHSQVASVEAPGGGSTLTPAMQALPVTLHADSLARARCMADTTLSVCSAHPPDVLCRHDEGDMPHVHDIESPSEKGKIYAVSSGNSLGLNATWHGYKTGTYKIFEYVPKTVAPHKYQTFRAARDAALAWLLTSCEGMALRAVRAKVFSEQRQRDEDVWAAEQDRRRRAQQQHDEATWAREQRARRLHARGPHSLARSRSCSRSRSRSRSRSGSLSISCSGSPSSSRSRSCSRSSSRRPPPSQPGRSTPDAPVPLSPAPVDTAAATPGTARVFAPLKHERSAQGQAHQRELKRARKALKRARAAEQDASHAAPPPTEETAAAEVARLRAQLAQRDRQVTSVCKRMRRETRAALERGEQRAVAKQKERQRSKRTAKALRNTGGAARRDRKHRNKQRNAQQQGLPPPPPPKQRRQSRQQGQQQFRPPPPRQPWNQWRRQ